MTGKQMLKLLGSRGWEVIRIVGSHHQMAHPDFGHTVSVPVHGKKELGKGLEQTILKQARLR